MCRFINADEESNLAANGDYASLNLFAYCGNNPVVRQDDGGAFWNIVIGAAVGGLIAGITTAVQTYKESGTVDVGKTLLAGAIGAVNGGIAATGLGAFAQAGISAAATFVGDVAGQMLLEGKGIQNVNYKKALHNGALSGVTSLVGSALGKITSAFHQMDGEAMLIAGNAKKALGEARAAAGKSSSKLLAQGDNLISMGKKYINTARGISSVTGSILTWGLATEYSMS